MFLRSVMFVIILMAISIGVIIALIFPPWILAMALASLIILFGIGFLFK